MLRTFYCLLIGLFLVLLTSCQVPAIAGLPLNDYRVYNPLPAALAKLGPARTVPTRIRKTLRHLASPPSACVLPTPDGGQAQVITPDAYNKASFVEYSFPTRKTSPTRTLAFVVVPGIFAGAGLADPFAEQLLNVFTKYPPQGIEDVQVFVEDRRANLLESPLLTSSDATLELEALADRVLEQAAKRDLDTALEMAMHCWGLETHLNDLHEIVLEANRSADQVYLVGHSLGAVTVTTYAARDFGPEVDHLGQDFIDGLVLLDGSPGTLMALAMDDVPAEGDLKTLNDLFKLVPTLSDIRNGEGTPYFSTTFVSPHTLARLDLIATLTDSAPEALAPAALTDLALTNGALMVLNAGSEYMGIGCGFSQLGRVKGATFGGNLGSFLLCGMRYPTVRSVTGLAEGAEQIEHDKASPALSDVREAAAACSLLGPSPTNCTEHYQPLRHIYELLGFNVAEPPPGFAPAWEVTIPTLGLAASDGVLADVSGFDPYFNLRPTSELSARTLAGYSHLDMLWAKDNLATLAIRFWFASTF